MDALRLARNWNISLKLSLSIFGLVAGMFLAFILASSYQEIQRAEADAVVEVGEKTRMLAESVSIIDSNLRREVDTLERVFNNNVRGEFSIASSRTTNVAGREAPVLMLGDAEVNLNFGIPDEFTQLTGAYATLFVRDGDDFVRVTTSHKKQNGERAIGTVLDRSHPGYPAVLRGQVYKGTAMLFGGKYMTKYEPIKNAAGEVIGILYVGIDFTDSMQSLSAKIKTMKLGQSGEFYVLNAKPGKDYGSALIHRTDEGRQLLEETDASGNAYIKAMLETRNGTLRYLQAGREGQAPRERVVAFSYDPDWEMVIAGDAYIDEITASAIEQRNHFILFAFLIVAVVAGLLYFLVKRMVGRPIARALSIAETVAGGDLTSRIEATSEDESGRLMAAMQRMNASLAGIVNEVRARTASIAAASSQVAADSMELSSRTEQQAGALEETASAMEELSTTVKQNTESVLEATLLVRQASDTANRGGEVVAQVIDTMGVIDSSAKRIADIIGVIDGIAFQTNILALNAAVEAARAGEQGRGFAVVASEVRALAQRSAGAAKEIKTLINESVDQVGAGTRLVNEAGKTMKEVVAAVASVNDLMNSVSTTMREQSSGIEEINRAIAEMDQVTQRNSAHVEETATAAENMREQASRLAETVRFFRLEDALESAAQPLVGQIETRSLRVEPRSHAQSRKVALLKAAA